MISFFRHLHHVTQNCASINNIDQIFPNFSKKHLFYNYDNDEHLPIPLHSGIKPSRGEEFIINILLFLGIFSTARKVVFNDTLRG